MRKNKEKHHLLLFPKYWDIESCGVDEYKDYFPVKKVEKSRVSKSIENIDMAVVDISSGESIIVVGHPHKQSFEGIVNDMRVVQSEWFNKNGKKVSYSQIFALVCRGSDMLVNVSWQDRFDRIISFDENIKKVRNIDFERLSDMYRRMYHEIFFVLDSIGSADYKARKMILTFKKFLKLNNKENNDSDGRQFFRLHVTRLIRSIKSIDK